jgi:hypothetical protein
MTVPVASNHQEKLLTINTNDVPVLRDSLGPGIDVQPLFIDQEQGIWVIRAFFAPGVTLPRHLHTGQVFAYTLKEHLSYCTSCSECDHVVGRSSCGRRMLLREPV